MLLARGQLLKNLENLEPHVCGLEAATAIQVRTCSPTMAQYYGGDGAAHTWCNIRPIWQYAAADWVAAAAG